MTDENTKAADVFAAMKYGTSMCVVCRVNFPTYGRVKIEGMLIGYCRPCVIGLSRTVSCFDGNYMKAAEKFLLDLIRNDELESHAEVLRVRAAVQKIYARATEPEGP